MTASPENWYQCSCDICGVVGARAPTADVAAAAFSGVHGRYLCGPCRQMHGNSPGRIAEGMALNIAMDHMAEDLRRAMDDEVFAALDAEESRIRADTERLIDLFHRDYPGINLSQGSAAWAAMRALARDPSARTRFYEQIPMERLATLAGLVTMGRAEDHHAGLDPVAAGLVTMVQADRHAGLEMTPTVPAQIEPLPDWFREGSLLRRTTDGALVRIRTISESNILFSLGTTGTFTWPRTNTAKITTLFEPVTPTTRWQFLLEDE